MLTNFISRSRGQNRAAELEALQEMGRLDVPTHNPEENINVYSAIQTSLNALSDAREELGRVESGIAQNSQGVVLHQTDLSDHERYSEVLNRPISAANFNVSPEDIDWADFANRQNNQRHELDRVDLERTSFVQNNRWHTGTPQAPPANPFQEMNSIASRITAGTIDASSIRIRPNVASNSFMNNYGETFSSDEHSWTVEDKFFIEDAHNALSDSFSDYTRTEEGPANEWYTKFLLREEDSSSDLEMVVNKSKIQKAIRKILEEKNSIEKSKGGTPSEEWKADVRPASRGDFRRSMLNGDFVSSDVILNGDRIQDASVRIPTGLYDSLKQKIEKNHRYLSLSKIVSFKNIYFINNMNIARGIAPGMSKKEEKKLLKEIHNRGLILKPIAPLSDKKEALEKVRLGIEEVKRKIEKEEMFEVKWETFKRSELPFELKIEEPISIEFKTITFEVMARRNIDSRTIPYYIQMILATKISHDWVVRKIINHADAISENHILSEKLMDVFKEKIREDRLIVRDFHTENPMTFSENALATLSSSILISTFSYEVGKKDLLDNKPNSIKAYMKKDVFETYLKAKGLTLEEATLKPELLNYNHILIKKNPLLDRERITTKRYNLFQLTEVFGIESEEKSPNYIKLILGNMRNMNWSADLFLEGMAPLLLKNQNGLVEEKKVDLHKLEELIVEES